MTRIWITGLLAGFCLLLSSCASTSVPYPERMVFPALDFEYPQVDQVVLPSGDRLYLRQNNELPLVELTLMIPGGSIDDPAGQEGFLSLLSAALRSGGTRNLGPATLDQTLEQMAAELSIIPDTYYLKVRMSLRAEDLERGVEILGNLLKTPGYEPSRLETARSQMLEGVRRRNDDPGSIAGRLLERSVYGDHPLGRFQTVASLKGITRHQLLARHHSQIQPGNLSFGASGDFDPQRLQHLLNAFLNQWPKSDRFEPTIPPLMPEKSARILTVQKDIPQTTILMGHLGLQKNASDYHAARVMNYILGGGGFNSHLMREIRSKRGLAYSVYSYFQTGRRLPGLFVAGAETKTSSTMEVTQLIEQQIKRMQDQPVTDEELNLAKDSLINSFIFAFVGTHSVVEQQMRLDFFNYPEDFMETYRVKVAQVTAADVQKAARTYLHLERMQWILVGNIEVLKGELSGLNREKVPVDPKTL